MSQEFEQFLFPWPSIKHCCMHCLFYGSHESFCFSIGSWPERSHLSVVETNHFGPACEDFSTERRSVISLHNLWNAMSRKCSIKFGITAFDDVEWMISTSGNLLKSSMITRRYSPVGNGPQKSTETSFHGPDGREVRDIFKGSCVAGVWVAAWHGRQFAMQFPVPFYQFLGTKVSRIIAVFFLRCPDGFHVQFEWLSDVVSVVLQFCCLWESDH